MKQSIIKAAFPDLADEEVRTLAKKVGGRVLTEAEQKEYLRNWSLGYAQSDICRSMDISANVVKATIDYIPDFARAVQEIEDSRHLQVESQVIRLSTGKCRIIKRTFVAKKRDEHFIFRNGKQVFVCVKKEITDVPANAGLLMWYLQKRWPDKYGELEGKTVAPKTPDEILKELEEAAKEIIDLKPAV